MEQEVYQKVANLDEFLKNATREVYNMKEQIKEIESEIIDAKILFTVLTSPFKIGQYVKHKRTKIRGIVSNPMRSNPDVMSVYAYKFLSTGLKQIPMLCGELAWEIIDE